ncbi:unnamed protein product [Choristocarpus tenellus]
MKRAYYEAFWKARNLRKDSEIKVSPMPFEAETGTPETDTESKETASEAKKSTTAGEAVTEDGVKAIGLSTETSLLTPAARRLLSTLPIFVDAPPKPETQVSGLTQMYYMEEPEETVTVSSSAMSAATTVPTIAEAAWMKQVEMGMPLGMSQMYSLVEGEEWEQKEDGAAVAVSAGLQDENLVVTKGARMGRSGSWLVGMGVPQNVVKELREVELEHARLAMLAVIFATGMSMAGVVDAAHSGNGVAELAEVARAPILQPWVAGVILVAKGLTEGDGRLGKGALAGWAESSLCAITEAGSRALRRVSGEELRRFALDSEVKHGRLALASVFGVLAQQGLAESAPWLT